ncbi:hypothetical protein jhhlp_004611 [Lomentospora prolificans]|uniref:Uncharacterized protein n=1 Tax=Lomentospora prolificans TaxID=41688 RepID=A0A2N3NC62_9PEZI|nr:hypothetical protein jhhlp_004611 [Lomentospora prolificans]
MISSNTRSSRSRYSSPAQGAQGGGPLEANKNTANEASRAFMRRWMEPAVQNKPSFEEVGLVRYGVLENMQPLGSLPKVEKAAGGGSKKENNNGVVRKIVLKPSGAASNAGRKKSADATDDEEETAHRSTKSHSSKFLSANTLASPSPFSSRSPSPPISPSPSSPQPAPPSSSSTLPPPHTSATVHDKNELALLGIKDIDDNNDEDYEPRGGMKRKMGLHRSPIARRSLTRASAHRAAAPVAVEEPSATTAVPASAENAVSDGGLAKKRQAVDKAVDDAVQFALKYNRYTTAYALRTLYDEKSSNPQILVMFEDIFLQRADGDTLDQFASLMAERKQAGAKDNAAYLFFSPDAVGSPENPIPTPYSDLLRFDPTTASILFDEEEGMRAFKKQKTTYPESPSLSRSRRRATRGSTGSAEEEVQVHAKTSEDATASSDTSKAKTGKLETPTRKRPRSDSLGSDSSLSSISFDTPELQAIADFVDEDMKLEPGLQKEPKLKLKAQSKEQNKPKVQRQLQLQNSATGLRISGGSISKTAGKRADSIRASGTTSEHLDQSQVADSTSVDEEEEAAAPGDVSGAHPTRHSVITTGAGKTTVAQRKSTASTKGTNNSRANPAPGSSRSQAKARDTLSPSPSSSLPAPNSDEAPHGSHDGTPKPHAMPGVVRPLFPNLPVKASAIRSSMQEPEGHSDDESQSSRPGTAAAAKAKAKREGSAKPHDAGSSADADGSIKSSPLAAAPARKTRSGVKPSPISTTPATRSTRSAVKRTHDDLERTASPIAASMKSNAPSSRVTSRAATPVLQPPAKRQRTGPRVKTS